MVRTRFAPSPTGYMHIGNLRTALYEYLIAKSAAPRGVFVLRIEDTDVERFVPGAKEIITDTLNATGLTPDEGPPPLPDGGYGPYVQSERRGIYMEYAKKLIESGQAYYCFCTKERLAGLKTSTEGIEIARYDRHCLSLSKEEIGQKLAEGVPFVIRQKMPVTGKTTFSDMIFGEITVPNEELDDQILIKSDGYPTYNFANVVDDHLMGITHVVRGTEYLSSAPKYNLLYEAFGWEVPKYVHCPPVMKDAQHKLSKRKGDPSFEDLVKQGFLPEAVLNYIALLGWSPPDNREFMTLSEMEDCFTISAMSKSPSVFDIQKLRWMNGEYIKKMEFEEFWTMTEESFRDSIRTVGIDLRFVAEMVKTRVQTLSEIPEFIGFVDELPDYDTELYVHKKMKTDKAVALESLKKSVSFIDGLPDSSFAPKAPEFHDMFIEFIAGLGVKNGQMLWPIRTALSGRENSFGGAIELLQVFGKDESLKRIEAGIKKLEGN